MLPCACDVGEPFHTILVADTDHLTRRFVCDQLAADNYQTCPVGGLEHALRALSAGQQLDAAIVDLGARTLELIDRIRSCGHPVRERMPILVLSATADQLQRTRLLERGADDVIAKPFSYFELRARLANLLARATVPPAPRPVTRIGPIEIDPAGRVVRVAGSEVALTRKEYALLVALAADPTRVFTRAELMQQVWGYHSDRSRCLDALCARLRSKLAPSGQRLLANVWGVGYRLTDTAQLTALQHAA